jgi:hypothetical protein
VCSVPNNGIEQPARRSDDGGSSPSAELMVDPRSGTRCAIRDTRAAGAERYYWTVTVFGEPDPGGGWAHRRASSRTPAGIRLIPNGPLASLFWRFTDAVNYWTFQLQLCILDAICGPERTRFIAGPAWQPAGCAQSALCRAAPGALQSCNEPIGPKKDTAAQILPRIWLTELQ